MLVLIRKPNQKIRIGNDIEIEILSVKGQQVRIGIDAPKEVVVHREEVYQRIQNEINNKIGDQKEILNAGHK